MLKVLDHHVTRHEVHAFRLERLVVETCHKAPRERCMITKGGLVHIAADRDLGPFDQGTFGLDSPDG